MGFTFFFFAFLANEFLSFYFVFVVMKKFFFKNHNESIVYVEIFPPFCLGLLYALNMIMVLLYFI